MNEPLEQAEIDFGGGVRGKYADRVQASRKSHLFTRGTPRTYCVQGVRNLSTGEITVTLFKPDGTVRVERAPGIPEAKAIAQQMEQEMTCDASPS